MFTRRNRILRIALALSDLAVTAIAFELAYAIRQHLPDLRPFFLPRSVTFGLLSSALAIWWVAGAALGVYRRLETHEPLAIIKDTLRQTLLATALLMGWIYLLKLGEISRGFMLVFAAVNAVLLLAYRLAGRRFRRALRKELGGFRHYVIVGTGGRALEVARLIEAQEENKVLAFVRERPGAESARELPENFLHELAELPRMLHDHVVDEVIFAVAKQDLEQMEEIFLTCEEEGVKTRVLVNFFPHINSEIYLEKLQSVPLLTFSSTPENEYLLFLKRVFDLALSLVLLVLLSPLFLLVALLVKITSDGPVIFSQERCGLNGRRFRLYKFRSMYRDAERRRAEVAHLNELDGPVFKSRNDPRVTPLGRILRKLSVDEWPQLYNVLKGAMSFVGPRPPLADEVEQYERWQRRRLRMKPGLTCLWALEGRNQLDFERWMRLDLDYIEQWSLMLDFKILFRTIPRVLSGKGAS